MSSVASFCTFASSSAVPIAAFFDTQQENRPLPGWLAVSAIGDALSCRSEHSSALMTDSRDGIVLAGFAGEAAFLSALVDAFHRNHKVTYLCDASASHAFGDVPADEFTALFLKYPGFMGDVYETDDWITSVLPRKIGSANCDPCLTPTSRHAPFSRRWNNAEGFLPGMQIEGLPNCCRLRFWTFELSSTTSQTRN